MCAVGDDAPVGADLDGQRHRGRVSIDHDDGGTRDRLQHLDADVPETAGADHHAHITGPGGPRHLGDGVVGGQAGIGEGRYVGRLQRFVDPHHAAGGGAQVFGVPTVGVDAGELVVLAVDVVAEAARPAQPAGDQGMQDHLVPRRHVGHRVTHVVHPPGVLVTDGVGQRDTRFLGPLAFQDVQVGAADTRTADANHHIQWPFDGRGRHVGHLQFGVVPDHLDCLHRGLLVLVLVNCVADVSFSP